VADCEWTSDAWSISAANMIEGAFAQENNAVLSTDSTEPQDVNAEYGSGYAGQTNTLTSLCDTGCTGNGTTTCTLGACGIHGFAAVGTVSARCQHAQDYS